MLLYSEEKGMKNVEHAQETRRSLGCSLCQLGESAKPVRLWGLNARAEETHWEEAFFLLKRKW